MTLSQAVEPYANHEEGMKSRFRLLMMIMYRSSHIPISTSSEIRNRMVGWVRFRFHQSSCGMTTFSAITAQKLQANGPTARLCTTAISNVSPLYQEVNG